MWRCREGEDGEYRVFVVWSVEYGGEVMGKGREI